MRASAKRSPAGWDLPPRRSVARVAETLEFGVFIPQGWRLDLVGIAPDCQWDVMRDLVRYAEDGPWDSVWVYEYCYTLRKYDYRAGPRHNRRSRVDLHRW